MQLDTLLRKMQINAFLYNLERKSFFNDDSCEILHENALALLESFSPNPNSSCIDEKRFGSEYDLEIIIPAYNEEKYIQQCMESVVSQKTSYRFHVTCVNDGSTDNTGLILERYSSDNVSIIHQKNKGFSGARNTALRQTNGKYIMFVDSDDFIPQGSVQSLLECAFNTDADIVGGGGMNNEKRMVHKQIL